VIKQGAKEDDPMVEVTVALPAGIGREKRAVLDEVLALEWDMFQRVRSNRPAPCQSAPERFRMIRGSLFETWTERMLASYVKDLEDAAACGRNLLSEKYARMDNLIPPRNTNPVIDQIVELEIKWQSELRERYPALYECCCRRMEATGNGNDFSVYLRCELETYGDNTLWLYYENVRTADDRKENLAIESLQRLVRKTGYRDAKHADSYLSERLAGI